MTALREWCCRGMWPCLTDGGFVLCAHAFVSTLFDVYVWFVMAVSARLCCYSRKKHSKEKKPRPERLRLNEALAQGNFDGWSEARIKVCAR